MLSPVTITAGWVQAAATAYPAAARARPVTATIRALTRVSACRMPAWAPAIIAAATGRKARPTCSAL